MNPPQNTLTTMRYLGRMDDARREPPRRRAPAFHPLLVALFPPLALYAQNPTAVMWWEVLLAMGASLIATALVYIVARRLYATQQAAALATSWTLLLLFSYGMILRLEGVLADWDVPLTISPRTVLPLWGALLVLGLWWAGRRNVELGVVTQFAHVFSVFAVFGPLAIILIGLNGDVTALAAQPAEIDLGPPVEIEPQQELPDIYYLVFSGYADRDTLARTFRIDNDEFLAGLQRRGFAVADDSRTNYPSPELSMASALNLGYLGKTVGPKSQYYALLEQNRAAAYLKQLGYRYHHLGGAIDGLRSSPLADDNYRLSRMPTTYTDQLVSLTPLRRWLGAKDPRTRMLEKFERLDALARQSGPKFVLAYSSALQPPWTFDAQGAPLSRQTADERGDRENFSQQLAYVNRRLDGVIDTILANTNGKAVIVLQADEGLRLPGGDFTAEPQRRELSRRSGVLTAVYLPDGKTRRGVARTLSPVNTLRLVFHECFDADLPRLADETFYWQKADAAGNPIFGCNLPLTDVTKQLTGPSGVAEATVRGAR